MALHNRAFVNALIGVRHRAELGAALLDELDFPYWWLFLLTAPERFDDVFGVLHLIDTSPHLAKKLLPVKTDLEAARHGLIAYPDGHYQALSREVELSLLDQAWENEALQRWRDYIHIWGEAFEQ